MAMPTVHLARDLVLPSVEWMSLGLGKQYPSSWSPGAVMSWKQRRGSTPQQNGETFSEPLALTPGTFPSLDSPLEINGPSVKKKKSE